MENIQQKGDTWPKILEYNYKRYSDKYLAMRYKHYGIWQKRTWKEYYLEVKYLAMGLLSLGLKPGDRVAIIGDNLPQWYCAELAVQSDRGIAVGMFSDLSPGEIKYILSNSGAKYAVVEDQEQVDKILEIKNDLPLLQKLIYWNYKGLSHYKEPILTGYDQVLEIGEKYAEEHHDVFGENIEQGNADDVCLIMYSSGTTEDNPKGAVHSYKTIGASAVSLLDVDPWREKDNVFSYLPPAWMTEQICGIGCHLISAATLNFAESPETQQADMREIGPDILFANSKIWETQASRTQARILGARDLKKFAIDIFLPFGYKIADMRLSKKNPGFLNKAYNILANFLLLRPLRDSLGLSNIRLCYSTGAILSPDVIRFYHALNIPLKNIYQSAESGVLSCSSNKDINPETQGAIFNGVETRITSAGELTCRYNGVFLGYYNDPEKTASVVKDGWVYTGDSCSISDEKQLIFIDRINDIITLSSGDRLIPQLIESQLKFSAYIRDVWVMTDERKTSLAAVVIINYDNVGKWADRRKITYTTFSDLSQKPEIYQLITQEINKVNSTLSGGLKIKKFVNFQREFDPDEGEMTRNRKLRRAFLYRQYEELIKNIFGNESEATIGTKGQLSEAKSGASKTTVKVETIKEVS